MFPIITLIGLFFHAYYYYYGLYYFYYDYAYYLLSLLLSLFCILHQAMVFSWVLLCHFSTNSLNLETQHFP